MSKRRYVPFQTSLTVNLVAVVLLLGGLLWVAAHHAVSQAVESLSDELTRRVMAHTEARLDGFVDPIVRTLNVLELRMASGAYDSLEPETLDPTLAAMLLALPQVSSVIVGFENGREYMLLNSEEGWRSRITRPAVWGDRVLMRAWDATETAPPGQMEPLDYDSLGRPWNIGARKRAAQVPSDAPFAQRIHWTIPYRFFTTGKPGVTASVMVDTPGGRGVVALDLLLSDVSQFTIDLTAGRPSKAFVVRGDLADPVSITVLGLPAHPRFADLEELDRMVLASPAEIGGPVGEYMASDVLGGGDVHAFEYDGERWWGALEPSTVAFSENIWVGSVIPTSELLEDVPDLRLAIAVVTALLVLLAALRSRRLARLYAAPLGSLVHRGARLQRLDFRSTEDEPTRIAEIRQLGSTLESARQTLEAFHAEPEDARVARSVRTMLLPRDVPSPPGWSLAAWHDPAADVEGEFVDALQAGDGTVALLLADLPGHGVQAAIDVAQLRAAFRACVGQGFDPATAEAALTRLAQRDLGGRTPRFWLAALDPATGQLLSRDCGQDPTFAGARGDQPVDIIAPGDALLVASDGIADALDAEQRRFGADGLGAVLDARGDADAAALVEAVRKALAPYAVDAPRDRTVLALVRAQPD